MAFLRLGLTSFGGPVAHLGYFRDEFVGRRRWIDEVAYADLVALCQFLPGPASSQVAVSLGIARAGLLGGLAAWFGFTMPSALALIAFASGLRAAGDVGQTSWLHGLEIVAVAVVALAVWNMARALCPDRTRRSIAVAAACVVLATPSTYGQLGTILLGGVIGWRALPADTALGGSDLSVTIGRRLSAGAIAALVLVAAALQIGAGSGSHWVEVFAAFFRAGALVFGGGHVVLPLLQQAVAAPGWVGDQAFLAGYGAAQAVPGPLFTFSAYLGAVMARRPNGALGGLFCLVAIYLPSFLLLIAVLPFWDQLRRWGSLRAALSGVNAAVVGLLLAALYTPVWTTAITRPVDFGMALVALLLLAAWRVPPWAVVMIGGVGAAVAAKL